MDRTDMILIGVWFVAYTSLATWIWLNRNELLLVIAAIFGGG